jgi:hypothetical protein
VVTAIAENFLGAFEDGGNDSARDLAAPFLALYLPHPTPPETVNVKISTC